MRLQLKTSYARDLVVGNMLSAFCEHAEKVATSAKKGAQANSRCGSGRRLVLEI